MRFADALTESFLGRHSLLGLNPIPLSLHSTPGVFVSSPLTVSFRDYIAHTLHLV